MIKRTGLAKRVSAKAAPTKNVSTRKKTITKTVEAEAAPMFTFNITAGIENLGSVIEANEEAALAKARKKFGAPLNYGVFQYTAKRV